MENKGLKDIVGWHVVKHGLKLTHSAWVCRLEHCSATWCCSLSYAFLTYRPRANKYSFEAGQSEDENVASYMHEQFTKFLLDDVWNDEHYVRLQVKGRYVNEEMQISFLQGGYL